MVPSDSDCCTAELISPWSVDTKSDVAVLRSAAAVMVIPLGRGELLGQQVLDLVVEDGVGERHGVRAGPTVPLAEVSANWEFSSCRRQPPAVVVSRVWSCELSEAVEMVVPLDEAAGGVMSQAEASDPVATTTRATTAPESWRFTGGMLSGARVDSPAVRPRSI